MAHTAWVRASQFGKDKPAFGVGITATLASSRPHRTGERAFIAVQSGISGQDVFTGRSGFLTSTASASSSPTPIARSSPTWSGRRRYGCWPTTSAKPARWIWMRPGLPGSGRCGGRSSMRRGAALDPGELALRRCQGQRRGLVFGRDGTVKPAEQFIDPEKHYIYGSVLSRPLGSLRRQAVPGSRNRQGGVFNLTKAHPNKGQLPSSAVVALLEACQGKVDVLIDEITCLYRDKAKRWKCDLAMGLDAFQGMLDQEPGDAQRIAACGSTIHILNRPGAVPRVEPDRHSDR